MAENLQKGFRAAIPKPGTLLRLPALGFVSGHTLKHVAAAVGCWVLVRMFSVRARLDADPGSDEALQSPP